MHLSENTKLQGNKYRIIRFLASGGFGCTYEAEHVQLGMRVAIKEFFVKDFCNRDEITSHVKVGTQSKVALVSKLKNKFIDEAVALCKFNRPNIVRVYDVFDENDTAYYVMDFIDGKSLNAIIEEDGRLSEPLSLKYISQIADALSVIHKSNRLHLDIKPSNIMVDKDGKAILIDFGASKQYDEVDGENTSTLMGRTPGYAPIEQMGNNVAKFLPATDIYALAATLYKMLSGKTPLGAHVLASGEKLDPLPSSVSLATAKAIKMAMDSNKMNRPQTVGEFISMINNPDEITIIDDSDIVSTDIKQDIATGIGLCDGHQWVDLGLPSGLKWATCNIGATNHNQGGDYFAWGEIRPKLNYCEYSSETFKKGNSWFGSNGMKWLFDNGYIDRKGVLTPQHDAATVNWGHNWRMPTLDEVRELINHCKWSFVYKDGVNCFQATGPNGNSIWFPAAGFMNMNMLCFAGSSCLIWTSSPCPECDMAFSLYCFTTGRQWNRSAYNHYRNYGSNIRPVTG